MQHYLVNAMNVVACDASDPWARNFARSILVQSRRPRWEPSPKQVGVMRRLVIGLRRLDDDPVLIEEPGNE